MNESGTEQITNIQEINTPGWYKNYVNSLINSGKDLVGEIQTLSSMNSSDLVAHLGGKFDELPYEILGTLLVDGSDDENVALILRGKRAEYLEKHPEKFVGDRNAGVGIITYDGRFIPKSDWDTASESEKRAAMVGSTCFHFNSETPGMGSDPKDRW